MQGLQHGPAVQQCLSWPPSQCKVQNKALGDSPPPRTKPMSRPWMVTSNNRCLQGDLKLPKPPSLSNALSGKEIFFLTLLVIHQCPNAG